MKHNQLLVNLHRRLHAWFEYVDNRDLTVLRLLPPRWKRHLVRATYGLLSPLWLEKPITIDGCRLIIPKSLVRQYASEFEAPVCELMERVIRSGMHVADVGGSIGYHTVRMARLVGEAGKVFTFEPAPDSFRYLSANVRLNRCQNVFLFRYAAGEAEGLRLFHYDPTSGRNSFYEPTLRHRSMVQERRLDDVLRMPLDFVKLDVEGAELEALRGMSTILRQSPGIHLVVEWSPAAQIAAGHDVEALPRYLLEQGFRLVRLGQDSEPLTSSAQLEELSHHLLQKGQTGRIDLACSR